MEQGSLFLVLRFHPFIIRLSVKKHSLANKKQSSAKRERQRKSEHDPGTARPLTASEKADWWNLFGIDPRSLALFRIAIGVLLLVDLAIRAGDLDAMYTDTGMFSRAEICRLATSVWNWSFHFGSGSWEYQAMLFMFAAVLALLLLIGLETRIATIACWLMLVSIHHRVPPVLSGAENLLRMLLFWAMFLPLGGIWSVDNWLARRRGTNSRPHSFAPILSIASAAILLQMGLMYLFSAVFKSNAVWWRGEALAGILAHDFYASPPAELLLNFPRLLTGMTWVTLCLEWAAPLLLFFPKRTAKLRLQIIAALAAMHIGIDLCLQVGLFSYVALAGLTLFLPAGFWNSSLLRFLQPADGAIRFADASTQTSKGRPPLYYAKQFVCLVLLFYVFALNLNSLQSRPLAPLAPEKWRPLTRGLGLSQMWGMFGSIPSKDGWYVAKAQLNDGSQVDLLRHGAPVNWSKPKSPARMYPNHYWHKIFREMAYDDEQGFQLFRMPVAGFLCRQWNSRNPAMKQITEFELFYCTSNSAKASNSSTPQISRERLVHLDFTEP